MSARSTHFAVFFAAVEGTILWDYLEGPISVSTMEAVGGVLSD